MRAEGSDPVYSCKGDGGTVRGIVMVYGRPGGMVYGRPGGMVYGRPGGMVYGRPGGMVPPLGENLKIWASQSGTVSEAISDHTSWFINT